MYTKIGLGLLAATGLTFGVIGMQTGGASPAPPVCTNDGGVASGAGDAGAAAAGDQTGANNSSATDNGTGAEGNGSGINGDNGNGNGSGNGSGEHTPEATPPTTGANPSTGATDDDRFLDVQGNTQQIDVGDGTATVPSTHPGLTGHSRTLRHLLRIDGHLDTD